MKRVLGAALLAVVMIACNNESAETAAQEDSKMFASYAGDKVVVYQMMTRLFGNTETRNITYGTAAENGVGKFNDITHAALAGIRELGATHVWFTGVIEHATMTDYTSIGIAADDADVVKGRAGSPYAIKDYYDVNPDLAVDVPSRMQEFEALIQRTHEAGLRVLIDFVPNHVARQYVSDAKPEGVADFGANDNTAAAFDPQNNFYYLPGESFVVPAGYNPLGEERDSTEDNRYAEVPARATGNDQFTATPSVDDWFETVKLNYGVDYQNSRATHFDPIPDTWLKMRDILLYWAGKGVDGFRCDMAEMVPVAFWGWVIPAVKAQYPEVVFIAEIYNPDAYALYFTEGHFDYQYDKVGTYDEVRKMMQGTPNASSVWRVQNSLQPLDAQMIRFLENHDEQRIASPFFAGSAQPGIPGMVVSATLGKGPVLLYFGQEVGEPGEGVEGFQGEDGRTTIFDYWGVPAHQRWMNGGAFDGGKLTTAERTLRQAYATLLNFAKDNKLIAHGSTIAIPVSLTMGDPELVMAFLREQQGEWVLVLANFQGGDVMGSLTLPEACPPAAKQDLLSGQSMEAGSTISFSLTGYQAQIWQ